MQTERAEIEFALKLYIKMLPEAICKAVIHSSSRSQLSFETNVLQLSFLASNIPLFRTMGASINNVISRLRYWQTQ